MAVVINGDTGITSVNGTADAPSVTGTDTDTGVVYGTNTVSISTGGTERVRVDSSGNVGIGGSPSSWGASWKAMQVQRAAFSSVSSNYAVMSQNFYSDGVTDKYIGNGFATRYLQVDGQHQLQSAPSGTAGGTITFVSLLSTDKDKSVALQGALPVVGTGISFPSAQSASSDANTLDDYEEGTWTPSPNSGTFSSASGTYVKVGRLVTITMEASVGTGGGSQVTLPFASAGTTGVGIYMASQTFPAGTTAPVIAIGASGNTAYFRCVGTGINFQTMSFTAGAAIHLSISFMIA